MAGVVLGLEEPVGRKYIVVVDDLLEVEAVGGAGDVVLAGGEGGLQPGLELGGVGPPQAQFDHAEIATQNTENLVNPNLRVNLQLDPDPSQIRKGQHHHKKDDHKYDCVEHVLAVEQH
jgi:hypothetical protein